MKDRRFLTEAEVVDIWEAAAAGIGLRDLCSCYRQGTLVIRNIAQGKTYRHLTAHLLAGGVKPESLVSYLLTIQETDDIKLSIQTSTKLARQYRVTKKTIETVQSGAYAGYQPRAPWFDRRHPKQQECT